MRHGNSPLFKRFPLFFPLQFDKRKSITLKVLKIFLLNKKKSTLKVINAFFNLNTIFLVIANYYSGSWSNYFSNLFL